MRAPSAFDWSIDYPLRARVHAERMRTSNRALEHFARHAFMCNEVLAAYFHTRISRPEPNPTQAGAPGVAGARGDNQPMAANNGTVLTTFTSPCILRCEVAIWGVRNPPMKRCTGICPDGALLSFV